MKGQNESSLPLGAMTSGATSLVLCAVSFAHVLNDTVQMFLFSIYPFLKELFALNFAQIGWITLAFQLTASLLQPLIGWYTDRRPLPYSLMAGMGLSFFGVFCLVMAQGFFTLVLASATIGLGSAIFHPEASRLARLAAGQRAGLAQALFQVGGNVGFAIGPLLASVIMLSKGQSQIAWFLFLPALGVMILWKVGRWYSQKLIRLSSIAKPAIEIHTPLSNKQRMWACGVVIVLIVSKYFYLSFIFNYYTFYLIGKFGVSVSLAQFVLFLFLLSTAIGTLIGGALGDRFGARKIIWFSIWGAIPFMLILPHLGLWSTAGISMIAAGIFSSAFSVLLVYAQDLMPERVGFISGLFFGLAFGLGGLGALVMGILADHLTLQTVFQVCAFLPFLGLVAFLLPALKRKGGV